MRWSISILALLLFIGTAQAQEKEAARPQIGLPVQQAGALLKQRKYKDALAKLATADAVPNKTPYERYIIEGTRASIDQASGDIPGTIKALHEVLATGVLPAQDAIIRLQAIVQLEYQAKDYAGVIADTNRYYQQGGTVDTPRQLQVQAYYLQGDYANAARAIQTIVQSDSRAGKKPDENLLLTWLNSDFQQKSEAGRIDALKALVTYYPKPQYWSDLIAAVSKQPSFAADRLALDLDRIKLATGAMTSAGDYMDAAQLALLGGFAGEAKSFLDKGYAAGVLGKDAQADREKRLADMAGQQAADGSKKLDQQAQAATDAAALDKLGQTYAGYGQNDKAIAAYRQALQKGGAPHPGDVQLHLGIAELAAGQKAAARETLGGVAGNDGTKDLAQLWLLQARA
jgi:tetratricopeptide (TPR) repeat protein